MSGIERRPVNFPPIWEDALKSSHDAVVAETTYASDVDEALPDGVCVDDREDNQVGIVKLRSIRGLNCHDAERCMDMADQRDYLAQTHTNDFFESVRCKSAWSARTRACY